MNLLYLANIATNELNINLYINKLTQINNILINLKKCVVNFWEEFRLTVKTTFLKLHSIP